MSETVFSSSPRHIFVSMLFALAVGKLAQTGNEIISMDFVIEPAIQWLFALFVVLASWVDWTNSFTNDVQVKIKIVSKEFIILLLDVFILFAYFHLITAINISGVAVTSVMSTQTSSIMAIFLLYLVWDYLFYVHADRLDILTGLLPSVVAFLLTVVALILMEYVFAVRNELVITAFLFAIVIAFRMMHAYRSKKIS